MYSYFDVGKFFIFVLRKLMFEETTFIGAAGVYRAHGPLSFSHME